MYIKTKKGTVNMARVIRKNLIITDRLSGCRTTAISGTVWDLKFGINSSFVVLVVSRCTTVSGSVVCCFISFTVTETFVSLQSKWQRVCFPCTSKFRIMSDYRGAVNVQPRFNRLAEKIGFRITSLSDYIRLVLLTISRDVHRVFKNGKSRGVSTRSRCNRTRSR